MAKVKAGNTYTYNPTGMDNLFPVCEAEKGQKVQVVNLHNAPKANTMGQCHIQTVGGEFLGMCSTNSLE